MNLENRNRNIMYEVKEICIFFKNKVGSTEKINTSIHDTVYLYIVII